MTEHELHGMWALARWHLIAAQVAPTLLLAASVGFVMAGLGHMPTPIRFALAVILLAGGILGFAAEYPAGSEAKAVAAEMAGVGEQPLRLYERRRPLTPDRTAGEHDPGAESGRRAKSARARGRQCEPPRSDHTA